MPKAKKPKQPKKTKPKPKQKQKQKQYVKQSVKVNVQSSGGLGVSGGYSYPPQTQYIPQVFQDKSGENVKLQRLIDAVERSMNKPHRVQDLPPPMPSPVQFIDTPFDPDRSIDSNPILNPPKNNNNNSLFDNIYDSFNPNDTINESNYMTADEGDREDNPEVTPKKPKKKKSVVKSQDSFNPDTGFESGDEIIFHPSSPVKMAPMEDEAHPNIDVRPSWGGARRTVTSLGVKRKEVMAIRKNNLEVVRNILTQMKNDGLIPSITISSLNEPQTEKVLEVLMAQGSN